MDGAFRRILVWAVVLSMLVPLGVLAPAPSAGRNVILFSTGYDNATQEAGPDGTTGLSFDLPEYCYVVNASLMVSTHAGGDPRAPENLSLDVDGDGLPEWAFSGNGSGAFGLQDRDIDGNRVVALKFDRAGEKDFTIRLPKGAAVSSAAFNVTGVLSDLSFKTAEAFGQRPNDYLGFSVAGDCDLDRNGYDDVVAGAPAASVKGLSVNGYAAVFYSYPSGPQVSNPDMVVGTDNMANLGFSVAMVKDFTKDGMGEILAGAINATPVGLPTPTPNPGVAYLYPFDQSAGRLRNLPARTVAGSVTNGEMGFAVSEIPDIDSDGTADIAASELLANHGLDNWAGRVAILKSSDTGIGTPVNLYGEFAFAFYGSFIHKARDLDGDGRPDLVVGSRLNYKGSATGAVYIYLSKKNYDQRSPLVFAGPQSMANFSASGTSGDFNGDGYGDLAIGAPSMKDTLGKTPGAVFIFWGGPSGLLEERRSVLWGSQDGSQYGYSVTCAGDLDQDGADDLLVGCPLGSHGGLACGGLEVRLSGNQPVMLWGKEDGENLGFSVAPAGDVDRNGMRDIVAGAPFSSASGPAAAGRIAIYMTQLKAPLDPTIILGGSGAADWKYPFYYTRQSRTKDLSAKLNGLLSNPAPVVTDVYGNEFVDIPVVAQSGGPGVLIISNISIMYNWTARVDRNPNPETTNLTWALNNQLTHKQVEPPAHSFVVNLTSLSPGKVLLHDLSVQIDEAPTVVSSPALELPEDSSDARLLDLYTVFTDDFQPDDLLFWVDAWTNDTFVNVSITEWRWLSVDASNGTANDNWTGDVRVTVSAQDDNWLANWTNLTVRVTPVNDPPLITSSPALNATAGARYAYRVLASDAENQTVSYGLAKGPEGMRLNASSGLLEWTPGEAQYNLSFEVVLWASDSQLCATQRFNVSVSSRLDGVRITSIPPPTAAVGLEYVYIINASTGVANATLVFALKKSPQPMTLSPDGRLRWAPTASDVGTAEVSVEVSDGSFTTRQTWNVTVFPSGTPLTGVRCGIREPVDGKKVSGTVKVGGFSNTTVGAVGRVEVSVDGGKWKNAEGSLDWLFKLDTTRLSNGRHSISARAFDGTDYSANATVSVEVDNPAKATMLSNPLFIGALILMGAVAAGLCVGVFYKRRGQRAQPEEQRVQPPSEEFAVEDIFLIHLDGRLIHHATRRLATGVDTDILSSMLTAVTSFVKDALGRTGESTLGAMEYGDNKIILERGKWTYLAVVITGRQEPAELREEMRQVLRNVESEYGGALGDWDGNAATLADCKKLLAPLTSFGPAAAAPAPAKPEGVDVDIMSELEFYQGYVRLKVAVKNSSRSFIMDSALKVIYNDKALKLEKTEPDYPVSGREIILGNIGIKEKKTVALYLDPQICMESYIEGTLSFKDSQGGLHHVDMRKKLASVVCPIMHTDENINIPMMRRMLEGELDQKDTKIFSLPPGLEMEKAFDMCKRAVQGHDIRLVREFTEKSPTFAGEAWYFGKVKGRDDKLVVKTAVRADTGSADFYVASNSRLVVTGLLAELKNDLNKEYKKERPSDRPMEALTDEGRRDRIRKQGSLLDRHAESEAAPGAVRPPEHGP